MEHRVVSEEHDGFSITADIYGMGRDILVVIQGGKPHIGAVGIAEPRPSLADPGLISATSSVFTYLGHKEDAIAKSMAEEISRRLHCKTVAVAGAHWDNISEQGIAAVNEICRRLTERIIEEVRQG